MYRVKAKTDAEKDKTLSIVTQKRNASEDKTAMSKPSQHKRRSSQRTGSAGNTMPPSPTAISPHTTIQSHSIHSTAPTGSPTNAFTPVVNSSQSFTPQSGHSGSTSSPGGSEMIYPFSLGTHPGLYTPFGNSPPLFPPMTSQQQ